MNKIKYNQFFMLAVLATSLMAGLVYSLEWPQNREIASNQQSIDPESTK